jgi:hypothetical protein
VSAGGDPFGVSASSTIPRRMMEGVQATRLGRRSGLSALDAHGPSCVAYGDPDITSKSSGRRWRRQASRTAIERCGASVTAKIITHKKSAHAAEPDRPEIVKRRRAWFGGRLDLEPDRHAFVNETWALANIAHLYGSVPKGRRLEVGVPQGNWRTQTFFAELRLRASFR